MAVQVLLNIAVVTGAIPPTGLPLPLVSAGSTSIVMFMAGIGILLNIYRQSNSTYTSKLTLTFKNMETIKNFKKRKNLT